MDSDEATRRTDLKSAAYKWLRETHSGQPGLDLVAGLLAEVEQLTGERDRYEHGIAEHRDKLGEPAGIYDERLWSLLDAR